MRPGNNNRRGRGRGPRKPHGGPHGHGGSPNKSHNFDSSGPDVRVRGNAYQVLEKYLQLARDAGTAGDRVAAENFLQHADHYYRVVAAMNEGQRPRIGGREISVADVNVQNVSQGLSAALSGHGHSGPGGDDHVADGEQGGHGNGPMRSGNQDQGQGQGNAHPEQRSAPEARQPGNGADNGAGESAEQGQFGGAEDQPDYPEELLPPDAAGAPREGQPQEGRHHNRMGRGRRRGPGRRIRSEGEDSAAPPPPPVPGDSQ